MNQHTIINANNNISSNFSNSESDYTTVYICDDSIEGIFSAIYTAWEDGTSHTDVRTCTNNSYSLFETIIEVKTDMNLADKVAKSIQHKLSSEVYYYVYRAALSYYEDRAHYIYCFLQKAFRIGPSIVNYLQDSDVMKIFELARQIGNEQHKYLGFARFEELNNGVLACRITPDSNVVPLIAPHFADRLHNENWIILDTKRNIAAVHSAHHGYILTTDITEESLLAFADISDREQKINSLWKRFFDTIGISQRSNYELQRNLMPLHYRKYMKETMPF